MPIEIVLLHAALWALNGMPRKALRGCPGGYKDSYEVAAALSRYFDDRHSNEELSQ